MAASGVRTRKRPARGATGPRLTPPQERVLAALRNAGAPLGAYALRDRLGGQGRVAPTQIYRALSRLISLGLAHRLESRNAYVACNRDQGHGDAPVALAACRACGKVDELATDRVAAQLRRTARACDFAVESVTLELGGLCKACRPSHDRTGDGA
jgi:Fur family zinc uptake transcriptional regulator